MARQDLKQDVQDLLDVGFSHQQAFDQLVLQHPEAKPGKIAELLRHRPSRVAKERYRTLHQVLLVLVAASAALRVWAAFSERGLDAQPAWRFIGLVPFATLFMAYALYRWDGRHFQWVGWMNILGAAGVLRILPHVVSRGSISTGELGSIIAVAIGALALFLHSKAFPKYGFRKDPMGGPGQHVFTDRMEVR